MSYVIGIDEAGYGPNLGPLVISATVWQLPDGRCGDDLYRLLDGVIASTIARRPARSDGPPIVADSKALYQPGKGLRLLERAVMVALAVLECRPRRWRDIWELLAPGSAAHMIAAPWYADYDGPLPLELDASEADGLGATLAGGLESAGVGLLAMRSRVVFPLEFNRLIDEHPSKGAALSSVTLQLAAEMANRLSGGPLSIVCDKHGGRNRYTALLSRHFPDRLFQVVREGRHESVYRFGEPNEMTEIAFRSGGEAHMPTALASMASKYLRELAMRALNAFWCSQVGGLRPTAGYPMDARRFKNQIAGAQAALGIEDALFWRRK
jgi:hypothetical protein